VRYGSQPPGRRAWLSLRPGTMELVQVGSQFQKHSSPLKPLRTQAKTFPENVRETSSRCYHPSLAASHALGRSGFRCGWILSRLPLLATQVGAQNFAVEGQIVAGGGGVSANARFSLAGALGQVDAGKSAGASHTMEGITWSLVTPARCPAAPSLAVTRKGETFEISWASSGEAFALQEASNLAAETPWSNTAATPTLMNGRWVLTLPLGSGMRFFHLRWP
jgi:hypothetical protein